MNLTAFLRVAGWHTLQEEWEDVRSKCWSENTHRARKSQWKRYFAFCEEFSLIPLPADVETVGVYITYLARKCCYITITNYLSGLWALHDHWGVPHLDPTTYIIRSTLKGAKRLLGCESVQADPLSPDDLLKIYYVLDLSIFANLQFWAALCLMYRCLLRVSHVVSSPHTMMVKDLGWTESGVDVSIRSSKTIQYKERLLVVPVVKSPASALCPCRVLRCYLDWANMPQDSCLFPYNYNQFASRLRQVCQQAGLLGNYSSHSLRRGSATFLSGFLPLHDVKTYGDWRSWSVLLYISDSYTNRKTKDHVVADVLQKYR